MVLTFRCTQCFVPTDVKFSDALGFDTEFILCDDCKGPPPRMPRVTLFGAPDGQELARWTDAPERSQSEHASQAGATPIQVDTDALRGSDDVW